MFVMIESISRLVLDIPTDKARDDKDDIASINTAVMMIIRTILQAKTFSLFVTNLMRMKIIPGLENRTFTVAGQITYRDVCKRLDHSTKK